MKRQATRKLRTSRRHKESKSTAFGMALTGAVLTLGSAQSFAQADTNLTTNLPPKEVVSTNAVQLPDVVVQGRSDSLIGIAESAAEGFVGEKQLAERPTLRPGEVLETIPGFIVTQHSGSGKANQYFLRGFNLDHGTDFATYVGGVPVNMPTHAHGQGYTDLNFIIPELITGIDYRKGPYYAQQGDFASAGAANLQLATKLPSSVAQVEGGNFGYARGLFASSPKVGEGNLLYALELFHSDGPWDHPDDYQKINGLTTYSWGDVSLGYSITAMAYHGTWDSTDQIPKRAVEEGIISRFGAIDPTDGGNSQRYSLSGEWHRQDEETATKALVYGLYYDLDLFSNFTYFLDDPVNGDQFEQKDRRFVSGLKAEHTWYHSLWDKPMENSIGLQVRNDVIHNGLFHTVDRERLSTTRDDHVIETSISPYFENRTQLFEKVRSVVGLRGDLYNFDVDSSNDPADSGNKTDFIASPKASLIFGPWASTEFYANAGLGFHSNDGRGTTAAVDPADPLVRTEGAEVGVRTTAIPNLQSTLSLWLLNIDSELLFVGDAGTTEPSRPSRRYGVEFANYYTPTPWLTLDADFSFSHSRFRDFDPAGDRIPGSIESVIAAGISLHDLRGFFGELRVRYFGARALTEDNSQRSGASTLVNGRVGYEFKKYLTLAVEVFNIFDAQVSDIDYFYESRLASEPVGAAISDIHFHPAEPRSFRVVLIGRF